MNRFLHPQARRAGGVLRSQPDKHFINSNTNGPHPRPGGGGLTGRTQPTCGCTPTRRAPPCGPNWQNSTGVEPGRSSSPTGRTIF